MAERVVDGFFYSSVSGEYLAAALIVCERDGKRQGKGRTGCSLLENLDLDSHCAMEQKQAVQKQADSMGISCRVWRIQNSNVELPEHGESKCLQQRMVLPAAVSGYEGEKGKGCKGGKI